jgi:hypothetical protein
MVADQEFVRRPEWVLCDERWCPFYERCMGTGELAGTVEQVWEKVKREGGFISV